MCICQFLYALLQAAYLCLRNHKGTLRLPNLPVPLLGCDLHTGRMLLLLQPSLIKALSLLVNFYDAKRSSEWIAPVPLPQRLSGP